MSKTTSVEPLISMMIPIITAKTDGNSANVNAEILINPLPAVSSGIRERKLPEVIARKVFAIRISKVWFVLFS